jgi:2-keto-4-pentenoate hydratase/2-oxohepta-3-ene-1,7-dioic acid hydratase in catechol pathway
MRIVSFTAEGRLGVGVVDGGTVRPFVGFDGASDLRSILAQTDSVGHAAALREIAQTQSGPSIPFDEIDCAPVVSDPHAIWCAALTFQSHVGEAPGRTAPDYPLFFLRVAASQTGHRHALQIPLVSDQLDYEGELAVVIGRTARHVPVGQALDHVAGYSCYNEGSVRDWQKHSPQITPGKNFAATGGFGPWLVTPDEFGDPYSHTIITRVNGQERQREPIRSLLFPIEYLIHYLSSIHPLLPGDVIVCGTPGGVGVRMSPPRFLAAGDVVTVEIDGIGILENQVAREQSADVPTWRPQKEVAA